MKILATILMTLAFAAPSAAQSSKWPLYTKDYRQAFKRAMKFSGAGASFFSGISLQSLWITEAAARGLTSLKIDQERLSNEEADTYYRSLRPKGKYTLAIMVSDNAGLSHSPLRRSPLDYEGKPGALNPNTIFLQRANDRESFSRGTLGECELNFKVFPGPGQRDVCFVTFDRRTVDDQYLVTSREDKIEVQFMIEKKKFILDYKIKDLVAELKDL